MLEGSFTVEWVSRESLDSVNVGSVFCRGAGTLTPVLNFGRLTPASNFIWITPTWITSPGDRIFSLIASPLTTVPLEELRSRNAISGPMRIKTQCLLETEG